MNTYSFCFILLVDIPFVHKVKTVQTYKHTVLVCNKDVSKTSPFHRYGICIVGFFASCIWALHIPISSIDLLFFWNITSYFHRYVERGIVQQEL